MQDEPARRVGQPDAQHVSRPQPLPVQAAGHARHLFAQLGVGERLVFEGQGDRVGRSEREHAAHGGGALGGGFLRARNHGGHGVGPHTVATGVTGEPTAPGSRKAGAVSMKR